MKKILIIGGTKFVGRNVLEKLIPSQKYDITLFNRGVTSIQVPSSIKRIYGDRKKEEDLKLICNQYWDCIIDVSGYWPHTFEKQLELQKGKVGRYIYISTCSHYEFTPENPHPIKEEEPIVACTLEEKINDDRFQFYNEKKAECERILQDQNNLDYLILRPGLIIGKYDYTDRLYYWFYKLKTQEELLMANNGTGKISYSDVEDLAGIICQAIEIKNNKYKVYNTPSFETGLIDFISFAREKLSKKIEIYSATTDLLDQHDVKPWVGLPLWVDGDFLITDGSRMKSDFNFQTKSIEQSVDGLISFYSEIKKWEPPEMSSLTISKEKEIELIQKLKNNDQA